MKRKCSWMLNGQQTFGYFHQFGTSYEEFDNGAVEVTVAIVEDKDGNLRSVVVDFVQFVPNDLDRKEYEDHKMYFGW